MNLVSNNLSLIEVHYLFFFLLQELTSINQESKTEMDIYQDSVFHAYSINII